MEAISLGRRANDVVKWRIYLQLGRVSNLPTVWTNVLAGVLLAGGALEPGSFIPLLLAFSLFYEGGMFLNDAFDRKIDARERPVGAILLVGRTRKLGPRAFGHGAGRGHYLL